jgi:hypothetical protein
MNDTELKALIERARDNRAESSLPHLATHISPPRAGEVKSFHHRVYPVSSRICGGGAERSEAKGASAALSPRHASRFAVA